MISFRCPSCNAAIEVSDQYAGQEARCPTCSHKLHVPAKAEVRPEEEIEPVDGAASVSSTNTVRLDGHTYQIRPRLEGVLVAASIMLAASLVAFVIAGLTLQTYMPWVMASLLGAGVAIFGTLLVLPGYYNVSRSHGRKTGEKFAFVNLAAGGGLIVIFISVALVALTSADRSSCTDRLRSTHAALTQYAAKNQGRFPPKPETLIEQRYLPASKLTCPESNAREGKPTYLDLSYSDQIDFRTDLTPYPGDVLILMDSTSHTVTENGKPVAAYLGLLQGGQVVHIRKDQVKEALDQQRTVIRRLASERPVDRLPLPGAPAPPGSATAASSSAATAASASAAPAGAAAQDSSNPK